MSKQLHAIPKQLRVAIFLVLIISIFTGIAKAAEVPINNVRVVIDGESRFYKTSEITVGELLENENIELNSNDNINYVLDEKIENNMRIIIDRAVPVKIIIDENEERSFKTGEVTVGRVLVELKKEDGIDYKLADGLSSSSKIEKDMVINVSTVNQEITVEKVAVDFDVKVVENSQVPEGTTKVLTQGVKGEREVSTLKVYTGGELTSSKIISDVLTKSPVTQVVEKGTAKIVKTDNGNYLTTKTIKMKSTAYTSSSACTGKNPGDRGYGITASGMKAQYGVVAVDTSVIPLGTKLYIEGYGYAVAGDTGGAIKGNKVDLYFNDYNQCINYGVRSVTVHVLGNKVS